MATSLGVVVPISCIGQVSRSGSARWMELKEKEGANGGRIMQEQRGPELETQKGVEGREA